MVAGLPPLAPSLSRLLLDVHAVDDHYDGVQVPSRLSAKNMCTVTVKTKGGGGRAAKSLTASVEFAVVAGAGCATSPLFLLIRVLLFYHCSKRNITQSISLRRNITYCSRTGISAHLLSLWFHFCLVYQDVAVLLLS